MGCWFKPAKNLRWPEAFFFINVNSTIIIYKKKFYPVFFKNLILKRSVVKES